MEIKVDILQLKIYFTKIIPAAGKKKKVIKYFISIIYTNTLNR